MNVSTHLKLVLKKAKTKPGDKFKIRYLKKTNIFLDYVDPSDYHGEFFWTFQHLIPHKSKLP
jgi:hypothetical protein